MSLEGYTNSAFDAMGLSEYDMLFSVDTDTQTWYVTTGAYVADFADSRLESIFKDGFAAILDTDADEAAKDLSQGPLQLVQVEPDRRCRAARRRSRSDRQTGYGRRESVIGTIITILIIYWILKAIFGSGRRGGGGGRRLLVRPAPRLAVFEPAPPWSRPGPRPAARRVRRRSAPRRLRRRAEAGRRLARRLWRRTGRLRRRTAVRSVLKNFPE